MASKPTSKDTSWQQGKTLVEANTLRLNGQIGCDVICNVTSVDGTSRKIGAHKYILVTRSAFFESMLERKADVHYDIDINDAEPGAFEKMLLYMYTDATEVEEGNVVQLLDLADRFQLPGLVALCEEFVQSGINSSNVCGILQSSVILQNDDLINQCLEFIKVNTTEVLQSESFNSLSRESLHLILQMDELSCDEQGIYKTILKWANISLKRKGERTTFTDVEIREALGNCLPLIRFGSMAANDFAQNVASSDILNAEEKSAFFTFILTKQNAEKITKLGFLTEDRVQAAPEVQYCTCYNLTESQIVANVDFNVIETLAFKVDCAIQFMGILLLAGPKSNIQYTLALKTAKLLNPSGFPLFDYGGKVEPGEATLWQISNSLQQSKSINDLDYPILTHESVPLEPNIMYTLTSNASGRAAAFNGQLKSTVSESGVNFSFTLHPSVNVNPAALLSPSSCTTIANQRRNVVGIMFHK